MDRPLITWAEVTLDYCDTERAASFWSTVRDLPARSQSQPGWFQIGPATTVDQWSTFNLSASRRSVSLGYISISGERPARSRRPRPGSWRPNVGRAHSRRMVHSCDGRPGGCRILPGGWITRESLLNQ
jgi:hypothetical protein